MTDKTLFDLPIDPEQFSVLLPPSELRKIDFSALEFATARRAVIEYIKTYFPDDFNDFVSNNGIIMLVELLSYMTAVMSLRADLLANEGFLPTAISEDAVVNHLALINQRIKRATPAVVDVECSVDTPVAADIKIKAGQSFTIAGEDGSVTYELFKSPTDLTSDIVIPANKRGVIAYGVEGKTSVYTFNSDGNSNQKLVLNTSEHVLDEPIKVEVSVGGVASDWHRIDVIERAAPTDKVFEVRFFEGRVEFLFGDNNTGAIPPSGAEVGVTYRTGGGLRGRIGAGVIDEERPVSPDFPYTAPVSVRFRNVGPSIGGNNKESLLQAKRRAPRDFATHDSIVTDSDYAQVVGSFSHPVFGSVSKAIATIRTGKNTNLVELYVLADGPSGPVAPNEGLKRAIASYVDEVNVLTDHVEVLDAKLKPVDVKMTIVMNRSADASVIRSRVDAAVKSFFEVRNWDIGKPLYVSQLYDVVNEIDGIKYIDIYKPSDNVLRTNEIDGQESGVNINELITLGSAEISYYYEN